MSTHPPLACPVCLEHAPVQVGGGRERTVGTVAAAVDQRPVVACAGRHDATPPEVVDAAMRAAEEQILRARKRLLRGDVCRQCGATLTMPVRRTTRAVTIDDPAVPAVTLRFDLPSSRCPDCGADQVPSRSQEDLVVVVPALFVDGVRDAAEDA